MEFGPKTSKTTETNTTLQFDRFILPQPKMPEIEAMFLLQDFFRFNFFGNNLDPVFNGLPCRKGTMSANTRCMSHRPCRPIWKIVSWLYEISMVKILGVHDFHATITSEHILANEFQTFLLDGFDRICGMSGEAIFAIVNGHWKIRRGNLCATWCNGAMSTFERFCRFILHPTRSNVRWNHASRVSANVANARFRELRSVGFLRMVLNNGVVMFEIETFEIKHEL